MGLFFRLCAVQVIKEASRDIGSDPLLPASLRSVSQEGQTPCRTVPPNGAQGGDGRQREATGGGRGLTRCATEFTRLATAGLTPCSDGKEAAERRKGGGGGADRRQCRGGNGGADWRQRRDGWRLVRFVRLVASCRLCAGQVLRAGSRDIGSDPLLPASLCSVSQEGQTPCRTVRPSGAQGRFGRLRVASGGGGWFQVGGAGSKK